MSTPFVSLGALSSGVAAAALTLLSMDSASPADLSKITLKDLQAWILANASDGSIPSSAVSGMASVNGDITTINTTLLDKLSGTYGYQEGTDYEGIGLYWKNAIADYAAGRPSFQYKNQTTGGYLNSELITVDELTTLLATKFNTSDIAYGVIQNGWYFRIGAILVQCFTINTVPGANSYTFPMAFSTAVTGQIPLVVAGGRDAGADTNYPTIVNPAQATAKGGNVYTVQNGGDASGPFNSGYSVVTILAIGPA